MASSKNNPSTDFSRDSVTQAIAACVQGHVARGAHVAIALSGGLDSITLLHGAQSALGASALRLSAIHIHHGLSPKADDWARFCEAQCRQLNIPFCLQRVSVPCDSGEGIEGAARRLRYEKFAEMECDAIMLAHHRDDQAETVLLNLLRGAGVMGAAGMLAARGRFLRPFLSLAREDLHAYAVTQKLAWIEDESNRDNHFSRNFLRNEVFPLVKSRFPAADQSLAAAASHFAEAQMLLDELAIMDLQGRPASFPLEIECLRGLSEARGRNVLRHLFAAHHVQVASSARLEEVLRQMLEAAPDKHPEITFGEARVARRKGHIVLL